MLNDIIKEFKYIEDIPLHKGGPIGTDTLFYLHTLHEIPGTLPINNGLYLNGDFDAIKIHFTRKPYKRKDTLFPRIFRLGMRTTDSGNKGEYLDYFKEENTYLMNEDIKGMWKEALGNWAASMKPGPASRKFLL